jgi:hypothetical protein
MKTRNKSIYLPESHTERGVKTIYYRTITNNTKKHFKLNSEDEDYLYNWLTRFVIDICNKQTLNPELYGVFTYTQNELPQSGYGDGKVRNSILSYASGLMSNKLRNPSEDFTVKHIKYIQLIFTWMHTAYTTDKMLQKDLGYDYWTKAQNLPPEPIKFCEA